MSLPDVLGFNPFDWIQFIEAPWMTNRVQFRHPRSKKKRIRRKWAKDPRNYCMKPWDKFYQMGDTIYAHPVKIEQLKRELRKQCQDQ